jgi:hypothetical protein
MIGDHAYEASWPHRHLSFSDIDGSATNTRGHGNGRLSADGLWGIPVLPQLNEFVGF